MPDLPITDITDEEVKQYKSLPCRCGCQGKASHLVRTYEIHPCELFTEACCVGAMGYLISCASECGFPWRVRVLGE